MEKYRYIDVDFTCEEGEEILTRIIQVKKWYGWVTFYTIEDNINAVTNKTVKILKLLKDED